MAADFDIPEPEWPAQMPSSTAELFAALTRLVAQLRRWSLQLAALRGAAKADFIPAVTVGTSVTQVAHGLSVVPRFVFTFPHASATVFRAQAPDRRFVYLQASGSVACDVMVVP